MSLMDAGIATPHVSRVIPRSGRSLVAVERFIHATRDSGYKSTASAVAELVDNAVQAAATEIAISIVADDREGMVIEVVDNGCGMTPAVLEEALRFGGSTRFDDRNGLGRFGMGLPNSSVSQARRLEVTTWVSKRSACYSYLDVDEIASGKMEEVPEPIPVAVPSRGAPNATQSGTVIRWVRCDRLDFRRVSSLVEKLSRSVGRMFRYFLWAGVTITINGASVQSVDPLFLRKNSRTGGDASSFGTPLDFDISLPAAHGRTIPIAGKVRVTFSVLPVASWHSLSNEDKREKGVTKGAGMSIVRAKREVDYGWWFFGEKRKENYDDWWRCELHFDPSLDEAFGITHTKQQIKPTQELLGILVPDIEATAKTLNRHVRQIHEQLKFSGAAKPAENIANLKEKLLPGLPNRQTKIEERKARSLLLKHPQLKRLSGQSTSPHPSYVLVTGTLRDGRIFETVKYRGRLVVMVNTEHVFYRRVYLPLSESSDSTAARIKEQIDLLLLAAARAESMPKNGEFMLKWSQVLATFLS
jgi:hypothetical protein